LDAIQPSHFDLLFYLLQLLRATHPIPDFPSPNMNTARAEKLRARVRRKSPNLLYAKSRLRRHPTVTTRPTAILLISCPDQKGLVAQISEFLYQNNGNIVHADHHIDAETGLFLMRVEWELDDFEIPRAEIAPRFAPLAERLKMQWRLHFSQAVQRIAIMVSKYNHCLYDLLLRNVSGELPGSISLVISNHPDLQTVRERFGIPFHVCPIRPENKQ